MAKTSLAQCLALLVLLVALQCAQSKKHHHHQPPQLIVDTQTGPVQGFIKDSIARAFLGIPFADPPLRFAAAAPASPWSGVYNATSFPVPCIQSPTLGSEDCLYLNVFTPKDAREGDDLPVMFYVHGGRYWTGQSDQYAGQWLSGNGRVVLVTIQYRLSVFGFFATPELEGQADLNVGFQDQILAMQWVKDNIASFGGDPDRVTIFGESAGGNAAMLHTMVHPYSDPGAFLGQADTAILQSTWQWVMPTLAQTKAASLKWAASRGCNQSATADVLACMRALPAASIVPPTSEATINYFQPCVDGVFLTDQPYNLIKRGEYDTDVRIVIGHTQDEGTYMAYTRTGFKTPADNITEADYLRALRNNSLGFMLTDAQIDEVLGWYAASTAQLGYWYGLAEVLGDWYIICGSNLAAHHLAKHGGPVYAFVWNYTSPYSTQPFFGASHGNELPYIFNASVYGVTNFAPSDYVLAARMIASWSRIAHKGKPAPPSWPRYKRKSPLAFMWEQVGTDPDPPTRTVPFLRSSRCFNWEPIFSADSLVQP